MDLLLAVNRILPVLGEHPVTSLTVRHPTLAILVPQIQTKLEDITRLGLWFNTYDITLYPDSEGGIAVPAGTLSFLPESDLAVPRALRLFNIETQTYVWAAPVKGRLTSTVPFEELPESAAAYVWYSALVNAYVTDIGMESNVRHWQEQAGEAGLMLQREHLRNTKYSTRRSPRYQRILSAMRG